jgi:hypothetical protein
MTQHNQTVRHWRIVFVLWFVVLTIATHLPQATPSDNPFFESPDKLIHFMFFGMLAFFFMCSELVKPTWANWLLVALWAFVDELTQDLLPINREFSALDLIASELGVASFMLWHGALSKDSVSHIRETIDSILSKSRNWFALATISISTGLISMALFWFCFRAITGKQYSTFAFLDASLISVGFTLCFFVRKGKLQNEAKRLIKIMLPSIFVTIVLSAMIGVAVSFSTFDPLVASLFILVVGLRLAWKFAT